ncbi:MAG: hypothetical protein BGO82_10850 [Devosia sp. 67-54]|nr:MAG: hypothetical protein BGO82_10850 [Devosia sp. 67-54]
MGVVIIASFGSRPPLAPVLVVWLLGVSQIVGYGTLYYSYAILAGKAAASLHWPEPWLFGAFSLGLLLGGLAAPEIGRRIDRHSAGAVMTLGSVVAALALIVASLAPNGLVFAAAVVVMQVAATLVLYDAAFTALVQAAGAGAHQRITQLTLIAGFASTIFWPLTAWLTSVLDWRAIYLVFALANLLLCAPLHALIARRPRPPAAAGEAARAPAPPRADRWLMWLMTLGFALSGFALSGVLAQMVPLLTAIGLGGSALFVSALFGPAQFCIRFGTLFAGRNRHPIVPALVSLAAIPASLALLAIGAPAVAAGILFIVVFGFGSGLKSIVQGSLPLALFGPASYGARLGVMASVRQVLASIAPFILASAMEAIGARPALWLVAGIGLLGLACLAETARRMRRQAARPHPASGPAAG